MDEIAIHMFELQQKGYCCSQILLTMTLELQGKTNPDLVRAMAGLCYGVGYSGDVCGALSGASCLLSLYAGKGSDNEEGHDLLPKILAELSDWFREQIEPEYGGITCDSILEKRPDKSGCGAIVYQTYLKTIEILAANGFNPNIGRS
jgi:C_GCAxxG_C_C family probable redox protein